MDKQKIKSFFDGCSSFWDEQLITDDNKMNEILDAAKVERGASVLDIACGTGVMFNYYLKREAASVTGVDLSPKMVKIAAEKFSKNERITVINADAEEYSFKNRYDCCVVFNAFPHFCNPKGLLLNLKAALEDGGRLTVAHDCGRAALDSHHKNEAAEVSCGLMSENELEKLFEECGFKNIYKKADDGIYIVSGER